MLYRTLKALISVYRQNDRTEALMDVRGKLDTFLSAGKLTKAEYEELRVLVEGEHD